MLTIMMMMIMMMMMTQAMVRMTQTMMMFKQTMMMVTPTMTQIKQIYVQFPPMESGGGEEEVSGAKKRKPLKTTKLQVLDWDCLVV